MEFDSKKEKILEKFNEIKQKKLLSFEKLTEIFGLPLNNMVPMGRIITIQSLPKRYDACFFGVFLNKNNILALNITDFSQNGSLFDLKSLRINLEESEYYTWITPNKALEAYYSKKILLAPPQIYHFLHFSVLANLAEIERFYSEKFQINPLFSNELMRNPCFFPTLFALTKGKNKEFTWFLPGDHEYPWDKIMENEESEELRTELRQKEKTLAGTQKELCRVVVELEGKILKEKAVFFEKKFVSMFEGAQKCSFLKAKL